MPSQLGTANPAGLRPGPEFPVSGLYFQGRSGIRLHTVVRHRDRRLVGAVGGAFAGRGSFWHERTRFLAMKTVRAGGRRGLPARLSLRWGMHTFCVPLEDGGENVMDAWRFTPSPRRGEGGVRGLRSFRIAPPEPLIPPSPHRGEGVKHRAHLTFSITVAHDSKMCCLL
jgi:hypothetical protein